MGYWVVRIPWAGSPCGDVLFLTVLLSPKMCSDVVIVVVQGRHKGQVNRFYCFFRSTKHSQKAVVFSLFIHNLNTHQRRMLVCAPQPSWNLIAAE